MAETFSGRARGLGTIPLLDDGVSVTWAAIDIDDNQIDHAQLELKVRELGLPLLVCRSKSGGAHCYLFLITPCPAKDAVDALTNLAAALGYPGAEIFPKQTRREVDEKTGNPRPGDFINLPYYGAETTDRYCVNRGDRLSLGQFIDLAEGSRVGQETLKNRHLIAPHSEQTRSAKSREGRNGLHFSLGCRMRSQGSDERTIRTELTNVNTLADPEQHENFRSGPLPDIELANIIKQVLRYESGQCLPDWAKGMNTQHAVVSEGGKTRF